MRFQEVFCLTVEPIGHRFRLRHAQRINIAESIETCVWVCANECVCVRVQANDEHVESHIWICICEYKNVAFWQIIQHSGTNAIFTTQNAFFLINAQRNKLYQSYNKTTKVMSHLVWINQTHLYNLHKFWIFFRNFSFFYPNDAFVSL